MRVVPILIWIAAAGSAACSPSPARREDAPKLEHEPSAPPGAQPPAAAKTFDTMPPPDAEVTASGLASKILEVGRGSARPKLQDKVRVQFVAWNSSGKVVDGSDARGGPVTFEVTGVIAGWREALQQMRVGERRRLWIPDHLVYVGRPGYPRANSVFELELLEIIEGTAPPRVPDHVAGPPADATKTASGLAYQMLVKGESQAKPRAWDRVSLRYTGWTADGVAFESRVDRPWVVDVARAIPGWREALPLLAVGDKMRLWLPESLAYQGRTGSPRGDVVFDIELVSIERRPEPPRPPAHLAAPPANAKRLPSGLSYRMLRRGGGRAKPTPGDRVEVQYSAWTSDGTLFDSTVGRGRPDTVPLNRIIPGWSEGLQQMVEGDKALFWIPERLAYAGQPGSPRGMLVYEVELLKIATATENDGVRLE